jgi:hypothetical protein
VTAATEVSRPEPTLPAAPEAVELTGAAAEMVPSTNPESVPVSAAPDGAEKVSQATARVPAKSTGRTALNDTNDVAMQHPPNALILPWQLALDSCCLVANIPGTAGHGTSSRYSF